MREYVLYKCEVHLCGICSFFCNPFCLKHSRDSFIIRSFFCDFKRDTSLLKRLADKDSEGCTKIHAKFFIKSFGSCFEIAVHADTDIACCRFSHGNHTIINTMAHSLTAQCQACV